MLAGVAAGGVLAPINSTMIAVALPELREDFGISHAEIGWLISAYLITMAVAQPIGGRLSDQLGRVRVFRAGLLGFLVCSLAATFAPTFAILVALRTGQAVFGAVLIPNGQAMLRETVPVSELGRINGLYGAVMSTSAAVGPLLGAALLALGSWRLLFLANVPIVAVALLLLARLDYTDRPARERPSIDWLGAAL
ncbi:MAG: MFS transporter, partial [Chloroflexi bacterium]|nr:MFS transporter [Chloroflexota bacterium]